MLRLVVHYNARKDRYWVDVEVRRRTFFVFSKKIESRVRRVRDSETVEGISEALSEWAVDVASRYVRGKETTLDISLDVTAEKPSTRN
jgi:hypothetical protein